MREVMNSCYLVLEVEEGKYHAVGKISLLLEDFGKFIYLFEIDEKAFGELHYLGFENPTDRPNPIPGIDITYGYTQRHDKKPFILTMRTPDPRRQDLMEIISKVGMKRYDQFEYFIRKNGISFDKWRVYRTLEEIDLINKDILDRME